MNADWREALFTKMVRIGEVLRLNTVFRRFSNLVPAHSFKFGATLQAHQKGKAPVLVRIEENTGHGAGAPVSKSIDEGADVLSFIFYNMKQEIVYDYQ